MPLETNAGVGYAAHRERGERLQSELAQVDRVGLAKATSNLFRDRQAAAKHRLDVRSFDHVLQVNAAAGWVDAEGMTTYEQLVNACLPRGVMPAVVPQLKTITLGGALAGVGIEATSFRHGLMHETVLDADVLTGDGRIVHARPDNEHEELFFALPNSYGTLGYALRVRAATRPVRPFVRVEHRRFESATKFLAALVHECGGAADFIDGVVFAADTLVLSVGCFVDTAPFTSDYTFENIYYHSLRERKLDYLTVADYLWRWDTDWFWCSKHVGAQHPVLRQLYGRQHLNSRTYTRLMRLNSRLGLTRLLDKLGGWHRESIIQDVDIPIEAAAAFLAFFLREIGMVPLWICPIGATAGADRFVLFPRGRQLYLNFGFWDVKRTREKHAPGHFNRMIERKVIELGGIKSLYSDSYFEPDVFDAAYGGDSYARLKARYDPQARLGGLYDKCVLRH